MYYNMSITDETGCRIYGNSTIFTIFLSIKNCPKKSILKKADVVILCRFCIIMTILYIPI